MIELIETAPDFQVAEAEYKRLLGYPRGHQPNGRAAELAAWAREWYTVHGRPWVYARETTAVETPPGVVRIGESEFHSERLRQMFEEAEANGAVLAAVSAGPEAEEEAQRLWVEEKPDEYFFLEMFASAVTEHLIAGLGVRLRALAERNGALILPHYSPGYTGWDVAEQPRLRSLIGQELPGKLETMDSGALRPKKSLLAVFGITGNPASLHRLTNGVSCKSCEFQPCQFRRAPQDRSESRYTVNPQALERWAVRRLSLKPCEDGAVQARFRYDGTTCTNMGRPLAFDYAVMLGPKEEGYPLRAQLCTPAANDAGHRAMCQYLENPQALMSAIESEAPLAGQPIGAVLDWSRPASPAGCYCDAASRDHKWGLVLETIHYALHKNEKR